MCPLFMLCLWPLDLCKAHKSPGQRKETKKKWPCHSVWLKPWTKEGLGKQNKCTDKRSAGGGVKNGFRQWETALPRCFTRMCDTCVQGCTFSSRTQKQHTCVFLWLWDGQKKERKKALTAAGGGGAAPEHHTQITLERTHCSCSFVELSHFNPRLGPFGNWLTQSPMAEGTPPPKHTHPCSHSGLQLSALPPLYCSSLVSGTHPCTHTYTHQSHPNNWPASCLSRPTGGVEREGRGGLTLDVTLVCVPYNFTAI